MCSRWALRTVSRRVSRVSTALLRKQAGVAKFVDRVVGNAEDVEVHDRSAARSLDDVNHPCEERLDRIAGDDQRAGVDAVGLGRLVQEGPHVAGGATKPCYCYSIRKPEMARAITSCWICSVPSKMS